MSDSGKGGRGSAAACWSRKLHILIFSLKQARREEHALLRAALARSKEQEQRTRTEVERALILLEGAEKRILELQQKVEELTASRALINLGGVW